MNIDGKTRICGLIGFPVTHTLSPLLHNGCYAKLGLNYCYLPFTVEPKMVEDALKGMLALNLAGLNVTAPHKKSVIPFLDYVDPVAAAIDSVNTICVRNDRLFGYSTDGEGFLWSLRRLEYSVSPDIPLLLLGAGGAARAVAYALVAAGTRRLTVFNRDAKKADDLAAMVRGYFPETTVEVQPLQSPKVRRRLDEPCLLVNALSGEPWDWNYHFSLNLPAGVTACDLRYSPPVTPFLGWARRAGARTMNGLGMLIGQAALSFGLFTGLEPPFDVMLSLVDF